MKKTLLIWIVGIIVMVALAFGIYFFTAPKTTGAASQYCGTWVITSAEFEDTILDAEELGLEASMTIGEGGKATLAFDGEEESTTWTETEHGITVEDMTFTLVEDGRLCADDEGVMMFFTKQ